MQKTLAEIAKIIEGEVVGDKRTVITGLCGLKEAVEGDLSFIADSKYISLAKDTKASALITARDVNIPGQTVIRTDNPSIAFSKIASLYILERNSSCKGIHDTAIIDKSAKLGKNVNIGPYVVIEEDVFIGDNTRVCAGSFVGMRTKIGQDCLIHASVTIQDSMDIGDRVVVHSGTVIGSDGFGYDQLNGQHIKIPQLGNIEIGNDVEIGANVTIDRARFSKTVIGEGTKIDNLVQIAHNVIIGKNCIIVALAGVSGSTVIEDNCILAGQVGVAGHLKVGKGSIVTGQSGVITNIPAGSKVTGYPAQPHLQYMKMMASLQKLPKYVTKIRNLEKKISELESKLNN